jgi:hypothetical protein
MRLADLESAVAPAVAKVAETMFFAEVLGELGAPPRLDDVLCAELAFDGVVRGTAAVGVDATAARALSSAFLGVDPGELTSPQIAEVVCELANMVAGASLSAADGHARFALTHPEVVSGPPAGARWFTLDSGVLGVALRLEV